MSYFQCCLFKLFKPSDFKFSQSTALRELLGSAVLEIVIKACQQHTEHTQHFLHLTQRVCAADGSV